MKNFYKAITVLLLTALSIAFTQPTFAESRESHNAKVVAETESDHEIEFYDYHSGVTHSYSVFNYVYRHLDNNAQEPDKKPSESMSR